MVLLTKDMLTHMLTLVKQILDRIVKDFSEIKVYQVSINPMKDIDGYELTGSITEYRSCDWVKAFFVPTSSLLQVEFKLLNNESGDRDAGAIQINAARLCGTLPAVILNATVGSYEEQISKALKEIHGSMKNSIATKAMIQRYGFPTFPTNKNQNLEPNKPIPNDWE